jgi:hypothetical protein
MIKMFEDYMESLADMDNIAGQLMTRVENWFTNTESGFKKSTNFIDLRKSSTPEAIHKIITINFEDDKDAYKIEITLDVRDLQKCKITMTKYLGMDPTKLHPTKLIFKDINPNDIKENFILDKIAKFTEQSDNPDENEIEIPTEEEPEEVNPEETPPAQGAPAQAPPAQGAPPQAPPAQGAPPQAPPAQAPPAQGNFNF